MKNRHRAIGDLDDDASVSHRANRAFMAGGAGFIRVNVIRLDESGEQDQQNAKQRPCPGARTNLRPYPAIQQEN
jgi:hypothetical protein